MRGWVAAGLAMMAGPAWADTPAAAPAAGPRAAPAWRLAPAAKPVDPRLRLDHPQSMLHTGYGGAMVDLFPVAGGKFHISGGPRLFGRAGRPRPAEVESLRYLPSFRGPRPARRFTPAMLVGYGRPVDTGLALGVDAGVVMGRVLQTPDRFGRLNRQRLDAAVGRERASHTNALGRVTALYRF